MQVQTVDVEISNTLTFIDLTVSNNTVSKDLGRQHRGCIIPQAVTHSLELLKMGKIIARNMLS